MTRREFIKGVIALAVVSQIPLDHMPREFYQEMRQRPVSNLEALDAMLRETYGPAIRAQLNEATPLLEMLDGGEEHSRVESKVYVGRARRPRA